MNNMASIPVNTWFEALYQCQQQGRSYVLITVLQTAGSTPREGGTKMLVTEDAQFDTIGGGHLEFDAITKARELLIQNEQQQYIHSYPLASALGQCCGGAMKVLFEVQVQHTQHVAIFGAGHVAQALVPILAQLPLQIRWVDNRASLLEEFIGTMPSNVECVIDDDPSAEMASLPKDAWAIVLTHNHQLDYDLVECGLKTNRLNFLGMIGSNAKAKRFKTRLANRGFTEYQITCLTSPIGNLDISGKRPVEVAVSISAQLINLLNSTSSKKTETPQEPATHKAQINNTSEQLV